MLQKLLFGVLAVATVSLTSLPSEAATFGTYGGTFNNGTAFDLTSNNSAPYSGMYIIPGGSLTLAGITQLSANYNMLGGSFGGGAPRFGIADSNDNQIWAYWGAPLGGGSFTNPNPNGAFASTGNFADLSSSDLRFYSNGFGGLNSPNTSKTWSELLSAVGNTVVAYIFSTSMEVGQREISTCWSTISRSTAMFSPRQEQRRRCRLHCRSSPAD